MILNLPAGLGDPTAHDIAFSDPSQSVDENSLRQAISNGGLGSYLPLPIPQSTPGLQIESGQPDAMRVLGVSTSRPAPQPTAAPDYANVKPNSLGSKSVNITDLIDQMGKKYNVDPRLIYSTIMTESSGHPYSYRAEPQLKTASYGLGQMLATTAHDLGFNGPDTALYDPATNLDLTAHYIAKALQSGAKTPQQVATFYNSGRVNGQAVPGHVNRFMQNYQAYTPGMEVDINQ